MEKLRIVTRKRPVAESEFDTARSVDQCVADGRRHEKIRALNRLAMAGEYPSRGDVSAPDDQKLSIRLTLTQSGVVKSHPYFRLLLGDEVDGSSVGVQRSEDGEIVFNFYFKQVYMMKMLTGSDVCDMLQVSRAFLAKLVRDGKLRSHKIGRLRRFSLEDVLAHLSESTAVW
jgi:excisionase family DNA binding protein